MSDFNDPEAVTRYAENPPRLVPGFADMQRMALLLLDERAMLREAGFGDVSLFYAAFTFRGWVAYA